jgi:repressor LexA
MLSSREQDTYRFIREYIREQGQAPLLTEIAEGLGIRSKGVVHRYVKALADQGLIQLISGRHRGIVLTDNDSEYSQENEKYSLPLLGRIAAGRPIEAIVNEERLNLAEFFVGPRRFVLQIQGDSMIDAGIMDGDMVVIEQRHTADDGDIVVALIDNEEATLKRIHYNPDGSIVLQPENRHLSPMVYAAERVAVQGVIVGQLRSYQ